MKSSWTCEQLRPTPSCRPAPRRQQPGLARVAAVPGCRDPADPGRQAHDRAGAHGRRQDRGGLPAAGLPHALRGLDGAQRPVHLPDQGPAQQPRRAAPAVQHAARPAIGALARRRDHHRPASRAPRSAGLPADDARVAGVDAGLAERRCPQPVLRTAGRCRR